MNARLIPVFGLVLALWMTLGRWAFDLGGSLTWWYLPTIGLGYVLLHLWTARRVRIARDRERRVSRRVSVSLVLSWLCAAGFGLTVPDRVDGQIVSLVGAWGGPAWNEMSIALCNPFGIIAFALVIAALGFAAADGRDPRPEEDEGLEPRMVQHPLD